MKGSFLSSVLMTALLCVAAAPITIAQETTATITGQITDSSGAAVSGADVTVTNMSTRDVRKAKSGDDGYYSLTSIPPGVYDISVKLEGFKEYLNKSVELLVNDRKTINIQLEAGEITEQVTVTA